MPKNLASKFSTPSTKAPWRGYLKNAVHDAALLDVDNILEHSRWLRLSTSTGGSIS